MTDRLEVVVLDSGYDNWDAEKAAVEAAGGELVFRFCDGDEAAAVAAVRGATIVLVRHMTRISRRVIEAMSGTGKAVLRYGVGYDNVDVDAAKEHGIAVCITPGYAADPVSLHAMTLMLTVARRIVPYFDAVREERDAPSMTPRMYSLRGRTLGFVGFGVIAKALHEKVAGLGFGRVLVYDPFARNLPAGVERVDNVDDICRNADVISLHAPSTKDTRGIINGRRLGLMAQKGEETGLKTILVNTSRGDLVVTDDLVQALVSGQIFGAGLDVTDPETLPAGHPLRFCDNVVITPHVGWDTAEAGQLMQQMVADEAGRVLRGEPLRYQVNP